MNKAAAKAAYDAGRAMRRMDTDDENIPDLGVDHCPFPEGDPQRVEWLRGFEHAMEGVDTAPIKREIRDALELEDKIS